ncbi:MAG: hypothetical protein VR64_22080 [Desulfatitalea sp. BRH_c12]|nr:MAG: hypothetical protein VR64_22080 [Desulfatitalea sp. BRH_c12]
MIALAADHQGLKVIVQAINPAVGRKEWFGQECVPHCRQSGASAPNDRAVVDVHGDCAAGCRQAGALENALEVDAQSTRLPSL